MNWIDEKFKEQLGDRKFPHSLKEKGEAQLAEMLSNELPLAKQGKSRVGLYRGLSVLLFTLLIGLSAVWYWSMNGPKEGIKGNETNQEIQNPISLETETKIETETDKEDQHTDKTKNIAQENSVNEGALVLPDDNTTNTSSTQDGSTNDDATSVVDVKTNQINPSNPLNDNKSTKPNDVLVDDASTSMIKSLEEPTSGDNLKIKDEITESPNLPIDGMDKESNANVETSQGSELPEPKNQMSEGDIDQKENEEQEELVPSAVAVEGNSASPNTKEEPSEVVATNEENVADKEIVNSERTEDAPAAQTAVSSNDKIDNLAFISAGESASLDLGSIKKLSAQRFAVSVWSGYMWIDKSVKGGTQSYRALREEQEGTINTMPLGLTMDYYISPRWTLSLGLSYNSYGEDLNYNYKSIDTTRIDGRYVSPKGFQNVISIDSTRVIEGIYQGHWDYEIVHATEDQEVKNNNGKTSWKYLEIPVLVGYRFGDRKVKPWIQTGLALGIPMGNSYKYLSPSGSGLSVPEDGEVKEAPLTVSYQLQVGIDTYLTKHFSLRTNVHGAYQLNPVYQLAGIKQNYYRLGFTLGLGYNF